MDKGTKLLEGTINETTTQGIDDLGARCAQVFYTFKAIFYYFYKVQRNLRGLIFSSITKKPACQKLVITCLQVRLDKIKMIFCVFKAQKRWLPLCKVEKCLLDQRFHSVSVGHHGKCQHLGKVIANYLLKV